MFSFLVGLFLFALDNTIVADVQPAIVNDFQSVDKISWLATGFFLATTGETLNIVTKHLLICSLCTSIWPIFNDFPGEMVLYYHGHHFRSWKCVVRSSTKHGCLNRRSCNCGNWSCRFNRIVASFTDM
jgi:hypothetical protein